MPFSVEETIKGVLAKHPDQRLTLTVADGETGQGEHRHITHKHYLIGCGGDLLAKVIVPHPFRPQFIIEHCHEDPATVTNLPVPEAYLLGPILEAALGHARTAAILDRATN